MPKSYRVFFESTGKKGLTEEQRKPLVNMRALMNSFKTNTLFLEKNAAKQVGTKELTEAEMHEYKEKMSAFRDSFRNASDILANMDRSWNKQPENQATAQKFDTCLNQTIGLIHMLQNNDQLGFFDTFMDAGLMLHDPSQEELMTQFYGDQRVPFDMKAQPLFDFLHFMNDNFDAGIDIKAFEDKLAAYQERRAQREIERENRLEEALTEKLRTKMAAASSEFDAAKLWLRGHETYKNAGIAFDQLIRGANMVMGQDLDKIDSLETLQELKDQISQKEIMSAYSEPVRKANKAYFDHKREDGQWNDDVNEIQNKNARNRIKAVKKMDEVADLLDQLTALKAKKLNRKIAEKQAKLKTDIPIVENKIIGDVIYKEEPLVSIEHDEIDLEDVTTINAFAGRRKAHAEVDIENDDDALEAEEPVIEKPEINADKENPAFTKAVQADRDQLWAVCNDIKKKQEITDQHREQFMSSFANILAASIMNESGLTAPGSKAYQEQKNAYAQSLIQDGSLKTMLYGKDTENFNKHLTNAFTKNANGLRFGYMDFLKQFKKDNLTNDKKNPMLELDKNMTK